MKAEISNDKEIILWQITMHQMQNVYAADHGIYSIFSYPAA